MQPNTCSVKRIHKRNFFSQMHTRIRKKEQRRKRRAAEGRRTPVVCVFLFHFIFQLIYFLPIMISQTYHEYHIFYAQFSEKNRPDNLQSNHENERVCVCVWGKELCMLEDYGENHIIPLSIKLTALFLYFFLRVLV